MGALIFYTGIYFLGYYAAHLLEPGGWPCFDSQSPYCRSCSVLTVSTAHAYKIFTSPPPHDHGDGAGSALGLYVILPVTIIAIAVFFFSRMSDQDDNESPP